MKDQMNWVQGKHEMWLDAGPYVAMIGKEGKKKWGADEEVHVLVGIKAQTCLRPFCELSLLRAARRFVHVLSLPT